VTRAKLPLQVDVAWQIPAPLERIFRQLAGGDGGRRRRIPQKVHYPGGRNESLVVLFCEDDYRIVTAAGNKLRLMRQRATDYFRQLVLGFFECPGRHLKPPALYLASLAMQNMQASLASFKYGKEVRLTSMRPNSSHVGRDGEGAAVQRRPDKMAGDFLIESPRTNPRESLETMGLLDFCKGIAIVWIVLVHARHGWFGWQGVHVFIVLAGFTLTHATLHRAGALSWRRWYLRRAERILPSYWLVAVAGFLVVILVATLNAKENNPLSLPLQSWKLFTDVTLLRNFSHTTMLADPNSALWFVPLIVSFYLLFPFLFSLMSKSDGARGWLKILLIAVAIEFAYRAAAIYWLDGILYTLWMDSMPLVLLMLALTLAMMVTASWLLLRFDHSSFPKRIFRRRLKEPSLPYTDNSQAGATPFDAEKVFRHQFDSLTS